MPFPKENDEILDPLGARGYNDKYLVLDFTECEKKYNIDKLQKKEKSILINKIQIYSTMTWQDVFRSHYKGLGPEHIMTKFLKKKPPKTFPLDKDRVLVLRLQDNKTIIGYQNEDRFMVLWLDRKRDVYKH